MKKIKKIVFCLVVLFAFTSFVNATCNDEELNEWATKIEAKFIEITEIGLDSSEYAYLLTVDPMRDDITIKVTDGSGASAEGKMLSPSRDKDQILAVGCYTNLEEETYTIEVYGAKGSACSNQLLRTLTYTVPRFNRYIKDQRCKDSDSEYCKTFTNSTKDMNQADFDKAMKEDKDDNGPTIITKILKVIVDYGLYIIIPLVIISIVYGIKINKFKKEERDR